MLTRRVFVSALAVLTAAGGAGVGLAARRRLALENLSAADLAQLEGTVVDLVAPDGTRIAACLTGIAARRRPGGQGTPTVEELSLELSAGPRASGGHYRLAGPDRECDPMLFTAVGREGRDRRLEAVLTRIA